MLKEIIAIASQEELSMHLVGYEKSIKLKDNALKKLNKCLVI